MGNAKATVCKVCGAPRDPKSEYALCPAHVYEYRRAKLRAYYERHHPGARTYKQRGTTEQKRSWIMRRTFERLGLRPGKMGISHGND